VPEVRLGVDVVDRGRDVEGHTQALTLLGLRFAQRAKRGPD
jgi:hypothetical protein